MAKTLFLAVLTLFVSTSFAEQFEDIKKPSSAAEWNEAAATIGMGALIVAAGKEKSPEAGKVMFSVKGASALANSSFPIVPSKTKPGQLERTASGKTDVLEMNDSDYNRSLFRNLLREVLKVAKSKDEKKSKAAAVVASQLLKAHFGKSLEEIAPQSQPTGFMGASGGLGKGKGKGLHLGGDLDLPGAEDGHAKLPDAPAAERLLNYLENPKAWVQATDCGDGSSCKPIPGQVMNPKLGGNLAIDDKLTVALGLKEGNTKPSAEVSPEAEAWLLDRLKERKKMGQTKFLIKFGADKRCPPCRSQSAMLKNIDPNGSTMLSVDVDSDALGNQIFHKFKTSDSIPLTVIFDLSDFTEGDTAAPEPAWSAHGVSAESTVRSQLGK